jgi:hypothetical protein
MARMNVAASTDKSKVLLHLPTARAAVGSINQVDDFHRPLGIESGRGSLETTRWRDAARDPGALKNAGQCLLAFVVPNVATVFTVTRRLQGGRVFVVAIKQARPRPSNVQATTALVETPWMSTRLGAGPLGRPGRHPVVRRRQACRSTRSD